MTRQVPAIAVFAACTLYALVRYTVFGDVSPEQIPMYVVNKGASFAGLILLGWAGCHRDAERRRELGVSGFGLIVLHVVLSLGLLTPSYFQKFFYAGRMTWQAESSMLTGSLSFLVLGWLFIASEKQQLSGEEQVGRSLPITLLSFVAASMPLSWPRRSSNRDETTDVE